MNTRLRKIERMESSVRAADRAARLERVNMDQVMGCAMLAHAPDYRIVRPEDTDPVTYRDIRIWVCLADRLTEEAESLEAQQPRERSISDFLPEAGGDMRQALCLWSRAQCDDGAARSVRTKAAIAAARVRLGTAAKPG